MELSREILTANCRIRAGIAGGSGTIIYSKQNKEGEYSTYVLTNHHVIKGQIKVDKEWSTLLKRDVKKDILGTVEVHIFEWKWESRTIGATTIQADIMTYNESEDIALLKLRSAREVPGLAVLYPRNTERELRLGMPIVSIGAAEGEAPIITKGILSQFGREIENKEFWISTAPTIFGNSGGATYLEETGQFIGMPARIHVDILGFTSDPITHLSYIIPISRIYKFLEDHLFRFIYDKKYTEEHEAKEREKRLKEEHYKIAGAEQKGKEESEDA